MVGGYSRVDSDWSPPPRATWLLLGGCCWMLAVAGSCLPQLASGSLLAEHGCLAVADFWGGGAQWRSGSSAAAWWRGRLWFWQVCGAMAALPSVPDPVVATPLRRVRQQGVEGGCPFGCGGGGGAPSPCSPSVSS